MNIEKTIILEHKGSIDQKQLNRILFELKEQLINLELDRAKIKKTYNIAVEAIENCMKHSSAPEIEFYLLRSEGKTIVETINLITTSDQESLQKLLESIKTLDQEKLLQLYVEKLRSSVISEKGGAGLGIVDMAIKSKNALEYEFKNQSEAHFIFKLRITIN